MQLQSGMQIYAGLRTELIMKIEWMGDARMNFFTAMQGWTFFTEMQGLR